MNNLIDRQQELEARYEAAKKQQEDLLREINDIQSEINSNAPLVNVLRVVIDTYGADSPEAKMVNARIACTSKPQLAPQEAKTSSGFTKKVVSKRKRSQVNITTNPYICYKAPINKNTPVYEVFIGFPPGDSKSLSVAWKEYLLAHTKVRRITSDVIRRKSSTNTTPASPTINLGEHFEGGHQLTIEGSSEQLTKFINDMIGVDFSQYPPK